VTMDYEQKGGYEEDFSYYSVIDKWKDLQLVKRGGDVYIEKSDGSVLRRVTSDPNVEGGIFSQDGKYIVYLTSGPNARRYTSEAVDVYAEHFYIQPVEGDEYTRQEITFEEYEKFVMEKISSFFTGDK
jgi:hypothetical protein